MKNWKWHYSCDKWKHKRVRSEECVNKKLEIRLINNIKMYMDKGKEAVIWVEIYIYELVVCDARPITI